MKETLMQAKKHMKNNERISIRCDSAEDGIMTRVL